MRKIPTTKDINDGIIDDLNANVDVSIPLFGKNFLRGLAGVIAGAIKSLYLTLGELQKNVFADTADPEALGGTLERFGRIKLGRNPFGAVAGQYVVTVTGTAGGIIPASQTFKTNDDARNPGILFVLDLEYEMTSSSDYITLRCLNGGTVGKLDIGNKLTATSPIPLVDAIATVTSESVEPLAAETVEDYRTKILNSFRLEAQGGASADFRLWSLDAQGVKNVYPYAADGIVNQADVYVEATIADSIDGKGTPSAGLLSDVEDVINQDPDTTLPINDRGRRPQNVIVNAVAVTVREVDIIITGYVGLNATIQALILSTITSKVNAVRPFVAAIDILEERNDVIDTNKMIAAIIEARPGSIFTSVTIKIDGVETPSFVFDLGDIPNLNSVTYL